MVRLREKEKLLKEQVQKQEALLHSLQLFNQPANKVVSNQTQETEHAGQGHSLETGKTTFESLKYHVLRLMLEIQTVYLCVCVCQTVLRSSVLAPNPLVSTQSNPTAALLQSESTVT